MRPLRARLAPPDARFSAARKAALKEVRDVAIDIAVRGAERLIAAELDDTRAEKMVEAAIKDLERKLSEFLGTDDTILYSSCWDANGGLFETILAAEDAVISDELNHASIIDGVRLCKAQRHRYKNNDMADLEAKLKDATAANARFKNRTR